MRTRARYSFLAILLISCTPMRAFAVVEELIAQLSADAWNVRATAVAQLTEIPGTLMRVDVKQALVNVLDRENRTIDSVLRNSGGGVGAGATFGEGYVDYYAALLGAVASFPNDAATLRVLTASSYNAESGLAARLASSVDIIGSTLVDLAHSDVAVKRKKAYRFMGMIMAVYKPPTLDAATTRRFWAALKDGTGDSVLGAQKEAIRSLGMLGDVNGDGVVDVTVTQGPFTVGRDRGNPNWTVVLTVTNAGTPPDRPERAAGVPGPIHVVVSNLSANATMVNKTGVFNGSPYITVSVGPLGPGASASVPIEFTNSTGGPITYTPVTYSGIL